MSKNPQEDEFAWMKEEALNNRLAAKANQRLRRIAEMAEEIMTIEISKNFDSFSYRIEEDAVKSVVHNSAKAYDLIQTQLTRLGPAS